MGIHLLRAMHDAESTHKPYWAAMPSKAEVGLNYETFPDAYLDLLESPHLVSRAQHRSGPPVITRPGSGITRHHRRLLMPPPD